MTATAGGITRAGVERPVALSGLARWAFPSSAGRPVRYGELEPWLERLLEERESFPHAARFLIENGEEETATELAANVWRVWILAGDVAGGRAFLASVLDGRDGHPSRARALALYGDGLFAFWQGALEESRERNEAALEMARAVADPEALALAHLGLSRVALEDRDHERSRSLAITAREHARELAPEMGQAPLHIHAQATRQAGDYGGAARLFEESLDLNRRIGDQGMVAVELHNLGHVEIHRGNIDAAERYLREHARLQPADDPYAVALVTFNQAAVAFGRGDDDAAAALVARGESMLAQSGIDLAWDDEAEVDWLRAQLADSAAH